MISSSVAVPRTQERGFQTRETTPGQNAAGQGNTRQGSLASSRTAHKTSCLGCDPDAAEMGKRGEEF